MPYHIPHYVNGSPLPPSKEPTLEVFNPATGKIIGNIGIANNSIINQAVESARVAFLSWVKTTPSARARILFQFKALLEHHLDELAGIITREHGKTLAESKSSLRRGIDVVDFACGIQSHLKGAYIESVASEIDCYSLRQPLGVCVGITPFNFPGMIPLWMFPLAIACGNTFVLKPSEKDPSCANRLVELAEQAGVPKGVINVVHGNKDSVNALISHPDVHAVSFVGSSPVAEHVYQSAIKLHKRAQAFGSAKNHCIVMPDADLELAAKSITQAAYGCAGERCMAISVVVTIDDVTADKLVNHLKVCAAKLTIGSGTTAVDIGPLVTNEHLQKVKNYIEIGTQEGAKLIVDGRNAAYPAEGFYLGCSLFDDVTPNMRIYKEEIFGPVLCVVRVADFETAIALINTHMYGNGTAIFTRDGYTARHFAARIQIGMVGINVPVPVPVAYHSFGGWKNSLFGDINLYGAEGVQFYTKLKTVTQRWDKQT